MRLGFKSESEGMRVDVDRLAMKVMVLYELAIATGDCFNQNIELFPTVCSSTYKQPTTNPKRHARPVEACPPLSLCFVPQSSLETNNNQSWSSDLMHPTSVSPNHSCVTFSRASLN